MIDDQSQAARDILADRFVDADQKIQNEIDARKHIGRAPLRQEARELQRIEDQLLRVSKGEFVNHDFLELAWEILFSKKRIHPLKFADGETLLRIKEFLPQLLEAQERGLTCQKS